MSKDSQNEQLSLFGWETQPEERVKETPEQQVELKLNPIRSTLSYHALKDQQQLAIERYLSQDIQSAKEMAELLIKEEKASNDRYITGKPMIYVQVCRYLDVHPHVQLQDSLEDKSDRFYRAN